MVNSVFLKIYTIPMGRVRQDVLRGISKALEEHPTLPSDEVEVGPELEVPPEAFNHERRQYRADQMLEYAISEVVVPESGRVLAITSEDLYSGGLNFVFGQAKCPGEIAVMSLHRLRPGFYGREEGRGLLLDRATKEAIHELGHTFGLGHCPNPKCVMSFSNSISDVDRKGYSFCGNCREKLSS